MTSWLGGPTRRLAAVAGATVVLLVAVMAVTIWRYEVAIDKKSEAIHEHANTLKAEEASLLFWHEAEAIRDFMIKKKPEVLAEIEQQRVGLTSTLRSIHVNADERALIEQALAANKATIDLFNSKLRPELGAGRDFRSTFERLDGAESQVITPIERLLSIDGTQIKAAENSASSAASSALVAGILAAVLALVAAAAFVAYALKLVGRIST